MVLIFFIPSSSNICLIDLTGVATVLTAQFVVTPWLLGLPATPHRALMILLKQLLRRCTTWLVASADGQPEMLACQIRVLVSIDKQNFQRDLK